jgi:hypothetical protein
MPLTLGKLSDFINELSVALVDEIPTSVEEFNLISSCDWKSGTSGSRFWQFGETGA